MMLESLCNHELGCHIHLTCVAGEESLQRCDNQNQTIAQQFPKQFLKAVQELRVLHGTFACEVKHIPGEAISVVEK